MANIPEFVRVEGMAAWPRIAEALRGKDRDQEAIARYFMELTERTLAKNHDYGSSVWRQPAMAPGVSVDDAIMVRISDKLERLKVLRTLGPQVAESRADTLEDVGIYFLLLALWEQRDEPPAESER